MPPLFPGEEARQWLTQAATWMDRRCWQLQAGSGVLTAGSQPLAVWPAMRERALARLRTQVSS